MPLIIPANSAVSSGYEVSNSLRFNSGSSDYLTFVPSSTSNQKTWTVSCWVKRSKLSANQYVWGVNGDTNGDYFTELLFNSSNQLEFRQGGTVGDPYQTQYKTNRLFRDIAWYHIVIAADTTDSTVADRLKIFINGVQETSFATTNPPSQNENFRWHFNNYNHSIGRSGSHSTNYFSGYIAEWIDVDGQQLAADQFGEFDDDSGIWKPINISGLTLGTNGAYLDFEDSSALGNDAAGSNNFTVNNLTAIDQTTDTCTNNFCTMNPLDTYNSPTITSGNTICNAGGSDKAMRSTIGISSGKWYWEVNTTANNSANMGIINGEAVLTDGNSLQSVSTNSVIWEGNGGLLFKNGSSVTTAYSGGTSTYGFALDLDNGTLKLSQNGTFYNSGNAVVTSITADTYLPFFAPNGGGSPTEFKANFGNPAYAISSGNSDPNGYGNFEYPTEGGYAICTKNLAEYG